LYLYKLYTMKENQYSKIIKLSLDYHKLSRTFEKVEQAFLTLMICIESMFKKSDNLWKDTPNIAKLLSETKSDYENILYKFKKNKSNPDFNKYYIEVRNSIAHGDDLLPTDEIKIKVLELHEYIRKCIIKILDINDEFELVNYYEDLFTCIEKKWQNIKM
ncbi:hypothetical protein, partial [Poseidonibacter sp.]|uniref:hypothetical protein n=1 Tax=Poseidonibacter sp. TaxID=2321188 RepID=UPI003C734AC3